MTAVTTWAAAARRDAELWLRVWVLFGGSHAPAWPTETHPAPDPRRTR